MKTNYYIVLNSLDPDNITGVEQQAMDLYNYLVALKYKPILVTIEEHGDVRSLLNLNHITNYINFYSYMATDGQTKHVTSHYHELFDKDNRSLAEFYTKTKTSSFFKDKTSRSFTKLKVFNDVALFPSDIYLKEKNGLGVALTKYQALTYFFSMLKGNSVIELFSFTDDVFKAVTSVFDKVNLNYPTCYDVSSDLNDYLKDKLNKINDIYVESTTNQTMLSAILNTKQVKLRYVPLGYAKNRVIKLDNTINFINVADIRQNKNQLDVLKAFNTLIKQELELSQIKDCRLTFYGKISDEKYYQTLIKYIQNNKLDNLVKFEYVINKDLIYEYDNGATYLLTASLYEGFGRAYLESLAYGIPIIAMTSNLNLGLIELSGLAKGNLAITSLRYDHDTDNFAKMIKQVLSLDYAKLNNQAKQFYYMVYLNLVWTTFNHCLDNLKTSKMINKPKFKFKRVNNIHYFDGNLEVIDLHKNDPNLYIDSPYDKYEYVIDETGDLNIMETLNENQ